MFINSTSPHYAPTQTGSIHPSQKAASINPDLASRWDTKDTFTMTIPQEDPVPKGDKRIGGTASAEYIADRLSMINYTADDLADVKERFGEISQRQKEIISKLQKILETSGKKLGMGDTIKVEIGSDGKAVIGGIRDARVAHALETAVNKDKEFVAEIKAFQDDETALSVDLQAVTGQSFRDFKARIIELQKGGGMDSVLGDWKENWVYDRKQCMNLEDKDIYFVDQEFTTQLAEYLKGTNSQVGTHDVNISGDNNILVDAEGAANGIFDDIMEKVREYLGYVNEGVRKTYADDFEEMKRHLVSLKNVTVKLNSDGAVTINGSFSIAGESDDMINNVIKDSIFKEELKTNPYSGAKNDYFIAAQYLENKYDLAFDGNDTARRMETVYRDEKVQSRISSPKEEDRLQKEIVVAAQAALEEYGVQSPESLDIRVSEDGKLIAANLPQDKYQRDLVEQALQALNGAIENRTNEDYNNLSKFSSNPIEKLKGLMAKMDVFLPGGVGVLKDMQPAASIEEAA